jgi:drug/metabolite transporter (DMT)-like permease
MTPANASSVRAIVRLFFGVTQMTGATVALICLIQTGVSVVTVMSVTITGVIALISRLLFKRERVGEALARKGRAG